jgi:outer membrane protein assembly factor BamB
MDVVVTESAEDGALAAASGGAGAASGEGETETEAAISFHPHAVESTKPSNMIAFTGIEVNGEELADITNYRSPAELYFDKGSEYTQAEGIFTFRGNNFRDEPAVGFADIHKNTITQLWSQETGATSYNGASWTGSGWTGQPLMRKWTREEKAHMNMHDWAKDKDDLVEVIYATMDGNVYFLDLVTGEQTRDPMYIGWTFKGAGALDPRGYPILYLGAGYNSTLGLAHAFVINLVDCTVMYEFGGEDAFSLRGTVGFFDSSPLVDAETDTLIWPGENGVIYMVHLNSAWDVNTGTLTLNPGNMVKWHYKGLRSASNSYEKYWLGIEDSFAAYEGYLFATDNGGHLMCLDLNTLELVWVQDTLDDSNSTPILSNENGHLYLYTSTSFRLGWRSSTTATVPIWKIDAETGEKLWETAFECYTMDGVSGGVQSTIALGKHDLSDYIYVTVSMTDSVSTGVLSCIDKKTGEVVWEHKAYYAWSSPVCVYNTDGSGVVIYCTSQGEVFMLDGLTGKVLSQMQMNGNVEASPAVYNDRLVVGTRNCMIYGVQLK